MRKIEPVFTLLNLINDLKKDKINIVCIKGLNFNPSTGQEEKYAFFYVHKDICYQCDNVINIPEIDLEFVRYYKKYNLMNLYQDSIYTEMGLDENASKNEEVLCLSNMAEEKKDAFLRLQKNLLNPHGRLLLHLNEYYYENAMLFIEIGLQKYSKYFLEYLEKNFPVDEEILRKLYVIDLQNELFDKVRERLKTIEEEFNMTNFDISNLAYIEKMQGNFEKACESYERLPLEKGMEDYIYLDYIWCLENIQRNDKAAEIKQLFESLKGGKKIDNQ
ncbi:MAG: hypothetical protein C0601_02380 [Candidatus Muiribacterium halophilum]|uniref:Uncharacterized protein n=1 Tax=Muiribacterium halophilum TaxID=2053465 RepID=A0A2N5ZKL1_MUIH1|nr:MAG: hypothetical protein C0601_02380 [Candidatus Muirbacterium halophilum]